MLRKRLNCLNRIGRKSYLVICSLVAIAIILTDAHPLRSQTPSSEAVRIEQTELVDLEKFSKMVATVENKWENDYEDYFQRDFATSSRSATEIAEHLSEIRDRTDINPAVVWAIPQDDFLRLLLITPDRQFIIRQIRGANRERLTARITELEEAISDAKSLAYMPPARIIYQWLFEPLDPFLEAEQIDTLLLCTGPTLRSLPFAALHDGEKFVIEKYQIARIPAFNLTDTDYQAKSDKNVLAMGASKFNDLPPLPGVEVELNTIVPQLWSGEKIINRDFTIDNFQQAHQQGDFDIVHIASHSKFNTGSPEDSYIQFSDRKLSLEQLADLELELPPVDLLVLSACETALGDKDAEFGFAGLAMQAGVKSAIASLWTINDTGTVLLMSEFYQQLQSTNIKAEALRKAQMRMLQQEVFVEGNKVRGSAVEVDLPETVFQTEAQNFSHPFYWAGFTLIGNPW